MYNQLQLMPYRPPLFIGSWRDATDGRGSKASKKKGRTQSKKGKGLLREKNSPFNGVPLLNAIL